jgi:hypothetical protein
VGRDHIFAVLAALAAMSAADLPRTDDLTIDHQIPLGTI